MADKDGWTVIEKKKRTSKDKSKSTNNSSSVDNAPQNSDFADWTNITLFGKGKNKKNCYTNPVLTTKKYNPANKQSSNKNAAKIERAADDGDLRLETVSHNLQLNIQKARQNKSWTQKQLATECNLSVNIIKSYENGTAVPDYKHLQIMSKKLGVTLKKN